MNSTITFRIPKQMKLELERVCRLEGVELSMVIRESLKRVIALHKFRRLRNSTLPFAERVGVFSDEDVFKFKS